VTLPAPSPDNVLVRTVRSSVSRGTETLVGPRRGAGKPASARWPATPASPDPPALAAALRRWLEDADVRDRIRKSAPMRRTTLTGWAITVKLVSDALFTVATHESVGR
jgi:hypothetical protein